MTEPAPPPGNGRHREPHRRPRRIGRTGAWSRWWRTFVVVPLSLAAGAAAAQADARPLACIDFDRHVNGEWADRTELPPDRARIGAFDTLRVSNFERLERALADLVADGASPGSPNLTLLATMWRSANDVAAIERQGLRSLQPWLQRIDTVERSRLPALIGELSRLRVFAPLQLAVRADTRDARRQVLRIAQAGLGLPDGEDYLRDDERSQRLREAYRRFAATLLAAAGAPTGGAELDALLTFESTLARASANRVQLRDPEANHHPQTLESLRALAPGFDWAAWLDGHLSASPRARITGVETLPLVLGQPRFAQGVARLAAEAPLATWRNYLRVRLLESLAEALPAPLADAAFEFEQRTLRGVQRPPPRAESLILLIGGRTGGEPMGHALGELYVSRHFSPRAQQRAERMVADIRSAMRARIAKLDWMSEPTRAQALAKLDAMVAKIGAPPGWRGYDGLTFERDDFAGNLLRAKAWATARDLDELRQPVDRSRWNTSPHIVNAFAAGGNQIVFPAGILQPPFFDENADDATNYGAIGMVIGHEITHHFDDRGRRFDAAGHLRDWWTAADAAAYRSRAERVIALYSAYQPLPGMSIAGRLTLGENISDLAGIQIAFDGLQIALARERAAGRTSGPGADGLTPEQRFFHAFARIWRGKSRPEALAHQLRTDSHSPGRYRVLGPLTQMPAFAAAFGCRAGDAMVADDPIRIW